MGGREAPDAHKLGVLAVEEDAGIVILRAKFDVGDVAESDEDTYFLFYHELSELIGTGEVGVGHQVDCGHRSLCLSESRQIVVGLQGAAYVGGAHSKGREAVGLQPDPHREDPGTQNVGPLDAVDCGKLRLDNPCQEVGHLIRLHSRGGESEVHGGPEFVGVLEFDDGILGLGGEFVADLRELGLDLRQGGIRIVVELQVDGDRAEALGARTLNVVDPLGSRDHALERGGDVAADKIGVGTHIGGGDLDDRDVTARILADV